MPLTAISQFVCRDRETEVFLFRDLYISLVSIVRSIVESDNGNCVKVRFRPVCRQDGTARIEFKWVGSAWQGKEARYVYLCLNLQIKQSKVRQFLAARREYKRKILR